MDFDVAPIDFFTSTADTKELFDGLTDHWVCPGCSTDVMMSIAQQVEFVEEGVVGDLGPIEWG